MAKIRMKSKNVKNTESKENRKNKKNNGITLIALVITIIVLLILAGVTIATLTGENGILTRASDAAERTGEANAREKVQLAVAGSIGTDGKINKDDLNTELSKVEGLTSGTPISSLPADVVVDGYTVTIHEDGSVTVKGSTGETGDNTETGIAGKYYEEDTDITVGGKPVTIPGGATVSGIDGEYENVEEGLVIYITNGDTITDWSDTETIQQTYDQFVWVPVEKAFVTEDEIGGSSYDNLKNYVATNGIYPMAIQLSDGNYKGILYDFGEGTNGVTITPKDYTTRSSYREPDVVTGNAGTSYDGSTTYLNQINGILNTNYNNSDDFKSALQEEYKTMVEKVNTNKGFWVGRYETSNMNADEVTVIKGTTSGINSVNWYNMYAKQANYSNQALADNTSITSSMIWGSQWDQIMIWMKDVKNTVNTTNGQYYVTNAVGMGNFGIDKTGATKGTKQVENTGYYEVKNIYDLAGNVYDWSLEANGTGIRVLRRRLLQ